MSEALSADLELTEKRGRVRRSLVEGGVDVTTKTFDRDLWEPVGVDGSVKRVFKPLRGKLYQEGVCLRTTIDDPSLRSRLLSAADHRRETQFLERVRGPHLIKIFGRAPLKSNDSTGIGRFKDDNHWEIVDFVKGVAVHSEYSSERGLFWPDQLTPAVRLRVLLAACDNQHEALSSTPAVYLTDLKTDAFIVDDSNELIKQVDYQVNSEHVGFSGKTVAVELVNLCLELFRGQDIYAPTEIKMAITRYLSPASSKSEAAVSSNQNNTLSLPVIIASQRRKGELPAGLDDAIYGFLNDVKSGKLKAVELPMNLANRLLPIVQRTEREEGAARAEKLAAGKRAEVKRRVAEKEPETWKKVVGEMTGSPYFTTVFESTGSAIAAGAAYQMREGIAQGIIDKRTYLSRVNQAAKLTAERKRGASRRAKPDIRQLTKELAADKIAEMAYDTTKSPVAAVVGYELSQEIMSNAIGKSEFINLVKLINALISGK